MPAEVTGTFTYDLATDTGKVRLLIADTDAEQHDFSDEEIAVALGEEDTLREAGAWLLIALASNRSRLAVSVRRGDVSEDLSRVAQSLRDQAKALRDQQAEAEDGPLEAVISPTYTRFSHARNVLLDREGRVTKAP